jgi:di/tricarboxylate transporter
MSTSIESKKLNSFSKTKLYGGILGIVLAVVIFSLPLGLEMTARITLALSVWLIIWLIFTPIESGYTALIFIFAMLLLKFESASLFTWFYISPGWFQIASFVIAAAMIKSGLAKRFAYFIMWKLKANTVSRFLLVSVAVALLMILLIPSPTAMVAILFPLTIYVAEAWNLPSRSETKKGVPAIALVSFFILILCGMAGPWIKTGFSLNLLTMRMAGVEIEWFEWFKLAAPIIWVTGLITAVLISYIFKPSKNIIAPIEVLKTKLDEFGSMSRKEKIVLGIMIIVLLLWVTESYHKISSGWIAIGAILVLAIPQFKIFESFDEAIRSINWSVIIFIAGIQAMSACLNASGASQVIAKILSVFKPGTALGYYGVSSFIGTFITSIVGINFQQGISIPIMIGWAQEVGLSASKGLLAAWLPSVIGGYLFCSLLPSTLFAWTFKYKGERLFTVGDGAKISLVLFVAYFVTAILIQLTLWNII